MRWHDVWITFALMFLAKMGDKTQIAVITLVAYRRSPLSVFVGAVLALTLVSLVGVMFGAWITEYLPIGLIHKAGAIAFILIGVLMLFGKV